MKQPTEKQVHRARMFGLALIFLGLLIMGIAVLLPGCGGGDPEPADDQHDQTIPVPPCKETTDVCR